MLRFVMGVAGTGKTTEILDKIKQRAQQGKHSILLVPEQFSSSAEGIVYSLLGDKQNALTYVVSFRTLAQRILREKGGVATEILSDAARVVFVRRALDTLGDEMRSFGKNRRDAAFCAMCAQTINELKIAGASSTVLRAAAQQAEDDKLSEIALLLDAYEVSLQNIAMDPEDRVYLAAKKVDKETFADKALFIDDFDGFTSPEYALLEELVCSCEDLVISLCCDKLDDSADKGLGLFSTVRKTAENLLRIALENGVKTATPADLFFVRRGVQSGLDTVNRELALGEEEEAEIDGITITQYDNEWKEICAVAAKMRSLALEGVPYSKMALVCRDMAVYRSPARRAFNLYDIPYFYDANETIEYTAPVAFLRAALRLLREGFGSGPILAILKTGLCGYAEEDISALENYAFTWNPKAEDWRNIFDRNPDGIMAKLDGQAEKSLEQAERLRADVVPHLQEFIQNARKSDASELSRQLYLLMESFNAAKHMEDAAERLAKSGETALSEASRRVWDTTMSLLDEMSALLGCEEIAPAEYDDLFLLLVRATEFGNAPQSLNCVTFTGADRMRLLAPEYCFVVGVLDGEFPMQVGYSGLLTHSDRDLLVQNGVQMPGSFEKRTLLEEMFFYRAMTSASRALHISYPSWRGGAPKFKSASLKPLEKFGKNKLSLSLAEEASTPAGAFAMLVEEYRANSVRAATLYSALKNTKGAEKNISLLHSVQPSARFTVQDKALLRDIVGEEMQLSPTRTEQYYKCAFAYFIERVLNIKPRRKAEISALESGSFVHYVLENVLRELGVDFPTTTDDVLRKVSDKYAELFIKDNLPVNTLRESFAIKRIQDTTAKLLSFLRDDAAQNEFEVDALELSIGGQNADLPPYYLQTVAGNTIGMVGKIDRVDTLKKDGKTYLRILDYKTGNKSFALDEVFCGLNMQMLVYMSVLKNVGVARYPFAAPAGILYLLSDPAPVSGGRKNVSSPIFKYDGLLLQDTDILQAMDKNIGVKGVFLPIRLKKDGTPYASKMLASLEKFGSIEQHITQKICEMADSVYNGKFNAVPLVKKQTTPCLYCAYRIVCRHEDGRGECQIEAPAKVFEAVEVEE